MKIRDLKTKAIGLVLFLILTACAHLGDGHHTGDHHSSIQQPSYQYSAHEPATGSTAESFMTLQNTMTVQEGTQTQSESNKGG